MFSKKSSQKSICIFENVCAIINVSSVAFGALKAEATKRQKEARK